MKVLNTSLRLACNLKLVHGFEDFDLNIIDFHLIDQGKNRLNSTDVKELRIKNPKSLIFDYSV